MALALNANALIVTPPDATPAALAIPPELLANPSGLLLEISSMSRARRRWSAQNGANSSLFGVNEATLGVATTPALATTNLRTSQIRKNFLSAAAANSGCDWVVGNNGGTSGVFWRGNAAGLGGFYTYQRFSVVSTVATQRFLVGWQSNVGTISAVSTIEDLLNVFGVGARNGDATCSLFHNDGAGLAAREAIAFLPWPNLANEVVELFTYCDPNETTIRYLVRGRVSGSSQSGTISTELPINTAFFTMHHAINNGGTATAVEIEIMSGELVA